MAYDQPGTPAGEKKERREGRRSWGEAARRNLRGGSENLRGGGGRSNKEREVESLIASAKGPCVEPVKKHSLWI